MLSKIGTTSDIAMATLLVEAHRIRSPHGDGDTAA